MADVANSEDLDLDRWAELRAQFLSSTDTGLSKREGLALAYTERGFSASGAAKHMDVSESSVKKYKTRIRDEYPGALVRKAYQFDFDIEAGLGSLQSAPNTACPYCEKDRVTTPDSADRVFQTSGWGATSKLDDAELVCSYCRAVRIDGSWERMQSADSRAYELSQSSSSKGVGEYKDILSAGEPDRDRPTADADDW